MYLTFGACVEGVVWGRDYNQTPFSEGGAVGVVWGRD